MQPQPVAAIRRSRETHRALLQAGQFTPLQVRHGSEQLGARIKSRSVKARGDRLAFLRLKREPLRRRGLERTLNRVTNLHRMRFVRLRVRAGAFDIRVVAHSEHPRVAHAISTDETQVMQPRLQIRRQRQRRLCHRSDRNRPITDQDRLRPIQIRSSQRQLHTRPRLSAER